MSVVVLYQGRRKTVKVRPMDPMQLVLQQAATEFGVNASEFALFSKKSAVDLAQAFRFTGLSNNALLELAPSKASTTAPAASAPVQVALTTPGGTVQLTCPASSSLVDVLRQAIQAGHLPEETSEQPVELVYLSQGYSGDRLLQTLQDLGLAGQRARFLLRIPSDASAQEQVPMNIINPSGRQLSETGSSEAVIAAPAPTAQATAAQRERDTGRPSETQPQQPQQQRQPHQQPSLGNVQSVEEESVPVVTPGIQGCREAIDQLLNNSFQADAADSVLLLMKYLANILSDPNEPKFRSIKLGNKAFQTKIQARPGASEFLAAVGFALEQRGLAHEIAQDPENRTFVTLAIPPSDQQLQRQVGLLRDAFGVLTAACNELEIPFDVRPKVGSRTPVAAAGGEGSTPAFDPFRSNIVRRTPQPRNAPEQKSVTDVRLSELQAKQEALQGRPEDIDRNVLIYLPGVNYGQEAAAAASKADELPESTPDDSKLAASYVAKSIAKAKAREDAPLQTKAMRDLARMRNQKVYSRTVIKVQLPNRVVLQANFHPRETVAQVRELLTSYLQTDVAATPIQLYIAPPRRVLRDQDSLADSGLVPAAVVYVSWNCDNAAPLETIFNAHAMNLIQQQLPPADAEALYPTGAPLVEQTAKRAAEAEGGRLSQSSSSQEAKSKSGKVPKWLKL